MGERMWYVYVLVRVFLSSLPLPSFLQTPDSSFNCLIVILPGKIVRVFVSRFGSVLSGFSQFTFCWYFIFKATKFFFFSYIKHNSLHSSQSIHNRLGCRNNPYLTFHVVFQESEATVSIIAIFHVQFLSFFLMFS